MITLCGHCSMDSAGNHEWGCPCSSKTYPGPQVDDVVAALGLRIAALEAQLAEVTKEKDGIKARSLSVIKARDHDLLMMRDAYSVAMSRIADMEQERDTLRTALRQVAEAADKARIFLKNLTMRTGVDTRVGRDGYKEYERLRDALAPQEVQGVLGRSPEGK